MQMDDMILVSIDDHMISRPTCSSATCPRWRDQAPTVVRNEQGVDVALQGTATSTPFGMAPPSAGRESGVQPGYAELRPGCFDVHQRVATWTPTGCSPRSTSRPWRAGARTFNEGEDKDVALVMMQAYNDWAIDEWCASYPGQFIPLGMVPNWDPGSPRPRSAAWRRRAAARSASSRPPRLRAAELHVRPLGPDARGDLRHQHGPVAAHRCRVRGDPPPTGRRRSTT